MEPQYSVPVRLTDGGVVYDNQDTLDRIQSRPGRGRHLDVDVTTGGHGRLTRVPVTSDVGNGHILRFVELRQVRAVDDSEDPRETGRQRRGLRQYATEDRYLVAPTVTERSTPSRRHYCRRVNRPDALYVNVENTFATTGKQVSSDPLLEEDTEHSHEPLSCEVTTGQSEHSSESYKESREKEEQLDEDSGFSRSTTNPDFCENDAEKTKNDDLHETGNTTQLDKETANSESLSCRVGSKSQRRASPDTTAARPSAQLRLADAYLLRMSPPPPSQQADGRRRAAYSDPVRWVSPVSVSGTDRQRRQANSAPSPSNITASQHASSGRPNGLRPAVGQSAGGVLRKAATTCTNEALDEAIQRRNRKCKPSVMRRLQAAKAVASVGLETTATFSSFEPIFEGVACSLRARSASLTDCNALAKSRGHVLNF